MDQVQRYEQKYIIIILVVLFVFFLFIIDFFNEQVSFSNSTLSGYRVTLRRNMNLGNIKSLCEH